MTGVSSIASRAVAVILVAVFLGSAMAGVAAGESATGIGIGGSTTALEPSLNETTDELESTTTETVENTTEPGDDTVSSTTETVDGTVNDTAETVDGTVTETTEAIDGVNGTVNASLEGGSDSTQEAGASSADPNNREQRTSETAARGDDAGGPVDPPSTGEAAANAVLVGLLGAIASGTAASGAAGAGTSGAAGGAGTAAAGWLSHLREGAQLRRLGTDQLRRAGADLWKVLPIFRYSRYDDSDPLEHDRRHAIYETIRDQPGTYLSAISDRTDIPLSTVRHHVRVLEDEDLIATRTINGKRRYVLEEDDAELQAALEDPAKRAVLEAIADCGRVHNGRLADELDRDPSTISHHLGALADDGLVVRERDGRSIVNELPAHVAAALADDTPSAAETSPAPADD